MSSLTPLEPKKDLIGLKLKFKPQVTTTIDLTNIETGKVKTIQIPCISRSSSAVLSPTSKTQTIRDLKRFCFLNGKNWSVDEVRNVVDEARRKYDSGDWLLCSFNEYAFHGMELLRFNGEPDSLIIYKREQAKQIESIKHKLLNAYYKAKNLPWRIAIKKQIITY